MQLLTPEVPYYLLLLLYVCSALFTDDAKLSKHIKAAKNSLELQESITALYAWSPSSSAVAKRLRDASCLSVVSFNGHVRKLNLGDLDKSRAISSGAKLLINYL